MDECWYGVDVEYEEGEDLGTIVGVAERSEGQANDGGQGRLL